MKRPNWLFFLLLLLATRNTIACGNEYYSVSSLPLQKDSLLLKTLLTSTRDNERPYWWNGFTDDVYARRDSLLAAMAQQANVYPESVLAKLDIITSKLLKSGAYKILSDFAWYELRVGNKEKALRLLEQLYQAYPNEYNIVANLGTAYELTGNNAMALELLRKAVSINPSSHFGSEWIHIRILEQKTAKEPDYKKIINLGTGDFAGWLIDKSYRFSPPADSLKIQLAYQLHERISLLRPPDAVVAQLVLDFADIIAKHNSSTEAIPFYEYAANYGTASMQEVVKARKNVLEKTEREVINTFRWASVVWAIPLLAFVLIFIAWLRGQRRR
jgi:tetratricopeptide (TPR) repeat protein